MRCARWMFAAVVATLLMPSASWSVSEAPKTLEIGEVAPNFTLPCVDGRDYSLGHFADSDVFVVVFTCNHCPTAQAYEDRIVDLARDYRDKGVALVAISPNDPKAVRLDELGYSDMGDSFEEMKIRAQGKGFNFPYLYDGDEQVVSRAYGPMTTPRVAMLEEVNDLLTQSYKR